MIVKKHWMMVAIWVLLAFTVILLPLSIFMILRYKCDKLEISDGLLNLSQGIIFKTDDTIPLCKVNRITVRKGIGGRIFGYGTIIVQSAAEYAVVAYPYVCDPDKVRKYMMMNK